MRLMLDRYLLNGVLRNAEDAGGAGSADPGAGGGEEKADAGTILFPDEGKGEGDDKGDGKGGEEKKPDDPAGSEKKEGDDGKKDDLADKVPEGGKYDLKMPEGIELDEEMASALGPEFAELKLTNAQAQKLVDKYIEIQQARAQKQGEMWAETVTGWADQAKKDPEIGGAKWDETVSSATRAVNALGTPALKEYLNASGGGNHPELIRFMAKVGAMVKEDNPATGGAEGAGKPADAAHILFPNDAPKGN